MVDSKRRYSSRIVDGVAQAPSRAMLHAVGFEDADFKKSQVGIASTWSMVTPCNMHIDQLAQAAAEGVDAVGHVEGRTVERDALAAQVQGQQVGQGPQPRRRIAQVVQHAHRIDVVEGGLAGQVVRLSPNQGGCPCRFAQRRKFV